MDEYLKEFCFGSDHLSSPPEVLTSSLESTAPATGKPLIWGTDV